MIPRPLAPGTSQIACMVVQKYPLLLINLLFWDGTGLQEWGRWSFTLLLLQSLEGWLLLPLDGIDGTKYLCAVMCYDRIVML